MYELSAVWTSTASADRGPLPARWDLLGALGFRAFELGAAKVD